MKVLHVPYGFYPDPMGGTEIYVESLAIWQRRKGVEAIIAAPGDEESSYLHDGLEVRRFAVSKSALDLRDLYGDGDRMAAASFGKLLESCKPDVVHLHAWTSGVSLRVAREAKSRGIPVVFTYHTPTVSCARGSLLRWGSEICAGELESAPCAACLLHGKGLNLAVSKVLGNLPPAVGRRIGAAGLSGGMWTAVRASELMVLRRAAFVQLLEEADHVVAVCEWVRSLLIRNGGDPGKITLCRQGVHEAVQPGRHAASNSAGETRLVFLGRVTRVKGIDLLLEALRSVTDPRLRLDIYGVIQDEEGRQLLDTYSRRTPVDTRIRFLPAVAPGEVISTLGNYDALVVPSQGLETGPLVVYEAFAAGIPVIGSDLGGIAELIDHDRNGLLVAPASVEAWSAALRRLVAEPALIARLRSQIPSPVRTIEAAADEMLAVYGQLRPGQLASEPARADRKPVMLR